MEENEKLVESSTIDKTDEVLEETSSNIDELIKENDEMRQRIFDLEHDVKVRDDKIAELKVENYRIKVSSSHSTEYHEEVKDEPTVNVETKAFDDFVNEY